MLLKRNLLEYVTVFSVAYVFFCIFLNCVTNISPITGIWFPLYVILVFILSISFSFKFIQWLLHMNKPIKYDLEGLFKDYPQFIFLKRFLPQVKKRVRSPDFEEGKEYDTNELSVISTVLQKKLVSSWYEPYISQEIGFPFACKHLLDQMIERTFKICNKIETKEVFIDTCSILTSHLREYKKTLKRHEKSPTSSIESLYKKTHPIFEKKLESGEHCTNILRIILKELVPWELWDTPHSELLVRILSKKLDAFIDGTLADPVWINDKLLNIIDKAEIEREIVEKIEEPEIVEKESETIVKSVLSTIAMNSVAPILQRDITEDLSTPFVPEPEAVTEGSAMLPAAEMPVLRQRRGRQREVKIYDRIVEGSVKTWDTDIDLQCISMGQDLLASLDGGVVGRLWPDPEPVDHSPPDTTSKDLPLWFGEEETLELEHDSPPKDSPVKKEHSPKPVELLKELQHSAKTKIGGLQVPIRSLDVRPNDEAAGMMEGLLDFGIAGLKKGLRFTGLSDDSQDKSPSYLKDKSERNSPTESRKLVQREPVMSSVIQREDNGASVVPSLVKQHRVVSQDSVPSAPKPIPHAPLPADSPEPEYEEAADLSASIAKLRSLLQRQGSPDNTAAASGDEVVWAGAEETRGRTQRHHCSRPVDTATLADEYDMQTDTSSSPTPSNRLDKLFQRTVTGVFNSIKTAVGAEGDEVLPQQPLQEWTYVCTSVELSVGGAVARLVGSRRAHSHVDAALDSLEQLAPPRKDHHIVPEDFGNEYFTLARGRGARLARAARAAAQGPPHSARGLRCPRTSVTNTLHSHVDAALDSLEQLAPPRKDHHIVPEDFEEWCYVYGGGAALAQLAGAAGLGGSHAAQRLATLLLADVAESLIEAWLEELASWLRKQVFVVFEKMADEGNDLPRVHQRPYNLDYTCQVVMSKIPVLGYIFGEEALLDSVKLSISSFGHKELNRDVIFRVLDLLAVHFKKSAGLRNPSFDAN
ncbi:LOW QUALITY PROTEIN: uncharacterized protein LOC133525348 [Cydia pomonella]|uniref:LOW QUALITY PROTEIN: uncharacterized protein LOC133525348 n=1 Tax=Cydia pomonella TaxID=82600 RepID=UPI002ADE7B40|nr:LOW QUALITY PROTEIN: uncharacterized protein LOC133525348 [Cydia pomonella]